uniref:Secreted CUB domain protein n=1 Tax=Pristhesancus plagipennis TaxID=1955184 RepID=A0A2K8JS54_PRIPG|nr:secreted CUB domain protein [Pristhesancus plagipennis]
MKVLLGLILCTCALYGSVNANNYEVHNATAIVRGLPLRRFFDRWNPKGLLPFTEFVYTVITDPDKKIRIDCPLINLHLPCHQYSFDIIDTGPRIRICGKVERYVYYSNSEKVQIIVRTGPILVPHPPTCSATVYKRARRY